MRIAAVFIALAALLAPASAESMPPLASGSGERVLAFDADITVSDTGDLQVIETIRVHVEGERIKRGIIRDLPLTPEDGTPALGRDYEVLSVTRDGKDEPFAVERTAEAVEIRIGSPDVLLPTGQAAYRITYKAPQRVGAKDGRRELYWNVTGNGWVFGIDAASATVHLPAGANATSMKLFTGPRGSTAGDGTIEQTEPGTVTARGRKPLPAGHGLTIAVEWSAAGGPRPAPPDARPAIDGMIGTFGLLAFVFVLPIAVLVL